MSKITTERVERTQRRLKGRKDLPPGLVIGYTAMDDAALRQHVDELRRLIRNA